MGSPLLRKRTDLVLECPSIARLLVHLPIRLGDRGGFHEPAGIKVLERIFPLFLPDPLAHPCGIHSGIDDEMCDVDILWSEFPRDTLGNCAQAEFRTGKCCIPNAATQAGGGASEEDASAPARQHQA